MLVFGWVHIVMAWAVFHVPISRIEQAVVASVFRTVAVLIGDGSGDDPTPRAGYDVSNECGRVRVGLPFTCPGSRGQERTTVPNATLVFKYGLERVVVAVGFLT